MSYTDQTEPTQQPAEYIDLPENLPGDDRDPSRTPELQDPDVFGASEDELTFEPQGREHSFGIIKGLDNWLRVPITYATSTRAISTR